jgi:hypothetical protein
MVVSFQEYQTLNDIYRSLTVIIHFREFRRNFEIILEGERQLDSARASLEQAMAKEEKMRKEAKRASKMSNEGLRDLTQKMSLAEHERETAQTKVMELSQEHEVTITVNFCLK